MKKNAFWVGYVGYVVILIMLIFLISGYVNHVLVDYEESQPEKAVEKQLEYIKESAKNGTLEEVMNFQDLNQAGYDMSNFDFSEYKDKIKNAKELSYKVKTGSYSESEQLFQIFADDEVVAVVALESVKEEIKLAILTISDWQVKSVTPVITLVSYNYQIDVPKGFRVTINGESLINPENALKDGWETYRVEQLYSSEPELKIYDSYGEEAVYNIVDNHVTPVVHNYNLRLPSGFTVLAGGQKQEGIVEGEETIYSITTIHEVLELTDAYGNSIEYKAGDIIYASDYIVTIPENFQILMNGTDAEKYKTSTIENSKYQYCAEYATMPKLTIYEMKDSLVEPICEIYDNLNQKVECIFENGKFEITEQTGLAELPAEISAKVDVLEIAKLWSKLMTNDLEGTQKGFGTMKKHLITNSYLYNVAYKWTTNIDITFVSSHVLDNPPFSEEKVTNYKSYGDNVFSCDISFLKHMDLASRNMKVIDEMNSTFYFMYYDETKDGVDNPRWVILDIQEIITE